MRTYRFRVLCTKSRAVELGRGRVGNEGQSQLANEGQSQLANEGQSQLANEGQSQLSNEGQSQLANEDQSSSLHVLASEGQSQSTDEDPARSSKEAVRETLQLCEPNEGEEEEEGEKQARGTRACSLPHDDRYSGPVGSRRRARDARRPARYRTALDINLRSFVIFPLGARL